MANINICNYVSNICNVCNICNYVNDDASRQNGATETTKKCQTAGIHPAKLLENNKAKARKQADKKAPCNVSKQTARMLTSKRE